MNTTKGAVYSIPKYGTEGRIAHEVEEAINSLLWSMDIDAADASPELGEWQAAKLELRRLMGLAYPRNHNPIID